MKKIIAFYFLFLFSFFSFFSSGVIDSIDGFQYLAVARNIYYTGEPTAPQYEYDTRENIHMAVIGAKNGKTYSLTGLGFSLAYLPAVFITDLVYKFYAVVPPNHFPLENDWLILLTAGFTNAFFGALLGVTLFGFFILLNLTNKQALIMSFISIVATNLFVYTKHSMPHMMFIAFLLLSFIFIKLFSLQRKKRFLFFAGLSFGVVTITYNPTFILAIPPFILYYLLLTKPKINSTSIKNIFLDLLHVFIGALPFILVFVWFETIRALQGYNMGSSDIVLVGGRYISSSLPVSVMIEGLYGQLLSPGRSIFIYSPLLLVSILFWHKLKKSFYPEITIFCFYSAILILFYAKAYSIGGPDQGIAALWHGESSWGPRYLTPLIPLGMLIVGVIYKRLSKRVLYFVFYPLVVLGIYIQILGILMPYQIKFSDLDITFFINGTQYTAYTYSNLLPRHTPILTMSKKAVKLVRDFPKSFNHGIYNVKFYDGIDLPFNVGQERWRVIEGKGYISFDENSKMPVKDLTFGVINHPLAQSSSSAKMQFVLNNTPLLEKPLEIDVTKRESIKIPVSEGLIYKTGNKLTIDVQFNDPKIVETKEQILALQFLDINGQRSNMETIDVPYVSQLGPKITGAQYQNWGGTNKDLWKTWHIHTQTFERLPDLWWIRNLFYWDIPRSLIIGLFILNLGGIILTGAYLKKAFKK